MESKSNDATPLRPEGDRALNAPMLEIDISKFISQIKGESSWNESDRNSITLFKSDTMRIVLVGLHHGAELKTHSTRSVISVQVLEGEIKFIADDQEAILQKGKMVALQPKMPHSVLALKESFFLLTVAALEN